MYHLINDSRPMSSLKIIIKHVPQITINDLLPREITTMISTRREESGSIKNREVHEATKEK